MVERLTVNQLVGGSSPYPGANIRMKNENNFATLAEKFDKQDMIKYTRSFVDDIENSFLNGLMRQQGIVIEDDTFTFLLYIIFIASWLYGFYRLTKQYKIKLFPNKYVKYLSYFMIIGWIVITLPSLKKKEINNESTNEL